MLEGAFWAALFAAVAAGGVAFEVRGDVVPFWRLFVGPVAALAAAFSLPVSEPRWLATAVAGFLIGLVAGSVRGMSAKLRVDHEWGVFRLRRATYDGVAFAMLMAAVVGADTPTTAAFLARHMWSLPFGAMAFGCAGYLMGRAGTIGIRARGARHDDMRPTPGRR
jgi:uncharacterized integral membrane protein